MTLSTDQIQTLLGIDEAFKAPNRLILTNQIVRTYSDSF